MAIARERERGDILTIKQNECLKMLVETIDWGSEVECG